MPAPKHRLPGWGRRAAMLLAHAQPLALVAVIAIDIARQVTDTPAVALAQDYVLGAMVLAFIAEHYHENRLCARCAAATPEDGAAAAQRHRRWLRLHHWATERVHYALILLIGSAVAAYAGPGAPWIIYPVCAAWALVAYANLRHRPVEPWCPHCRGWGWDDETDPVPPPVPAAGATRWGHPQRHDHGIVVSPRSSAPHLPDPAAGHSLSSRLMTRVVPLR